VGQDEILRPIVNRPSRKLHFTARRPISNRPQDFILTHNGSSSFRTYSELPAPPQEVRAWTGGQLGDYRLSKRERRLESRRGRLKACST
jgi:hypothetical protein